MNEKVYSLIGRLGEKTVSQDLLDGMDLLLSRFADKVDLEILNDLMKEMMYKYAELSRDLEKSNLMLAQREQELKKYNERLEDLVDEKVQEISDSQIATIYA